MNRFTPQLDADYVEWDKEKDSVNSSSDFGHKYTKHICKELFLHRKKQSIFLPFLRKRKTQPKANPCLSQSSIPTEWLMSSLEAPTLTKNFYFNTLDFSRTNSLVCALGSRLVVYDLQDNKSRFCGQDFGYCLMCVRANPCDALAAVGTTKGKVLLSSLETGYILRKFCCDGGVGAMDWRQQLLIKGTKNGEVVFDDIRIPQSRIKQIYAHNDHICALKCSPIDDNLFATGSTDNSFKIYDMRTMKSLFCSKFHTAAVKALNWSPFNSKILITGGGVGDERLALWDVQKKSLMKTRSSGAQVCNADFASPRSILCTFGWPSHEIQFRDQHLKICRKNTIHKERVLYLAVNRDRSFFATGSADKTVKVWKLDNGIVSSLHSERILKSSFLR